MFVGSAKPNIGHLEAAAGVAGMIRAILIAEKGQIPPHINFEKWNPNIKHEEWKVNVSLLYYPLFASVVHDVLIIIGCERPDEISVDQAAPH